MFFILITLVVYTGCDNFSDLGSNQSTGNRKVLPPELQDAIKRDVLNQLDVLNEKYEKFVGFKGDLEKKTTAVQSSFDVAFGDSNGLGARSKSLYEGLENLEERDTLMKDNQISNPAIAVQTSFSIAQSNAEKINPELVATEMQKAQQQVDEAKAFEALIKSDDAEVKKQKEKVKNFVVETRNEIRKLNSKEAKNNIAELKKNIEQVDSIGSLLTLVENNEELTSEETSKLKTDIEKFVEQNEEVKKKIDEKISGLANASDLVNAAAGLEKDLKFKSSELQNRARAGGTGIKSNQFEYIGQLEKDIRETYLKIDSELNGKSNHEDTSFDYTEETIKRLPLPEIMKQELLVTAQKSAETKFQEYKKAINTEMNKNLNLFWGVLVVVNDVKSASKDDVYKKFNLMKSYFNVKPKSELKREYVIDVLQQGIDTVLGNLSEEAVKAKYADVDYAWLISVTEDPAKLGTTKEELNASKERIKKLLDETDQQKLEENFNKVNEYDIKSEALNLLNEMISQEIDGISFNSALTAFNSATNLRELWDAKKKLGKVLNQGFFPYKLSNPFWTIAAELQKHLKNVDQQFYTRAFELAGNPVDAIAALARESDEYKKISNRANAKYLAVENLKKDKKTTVLFASYEQALKSIEKGLVTSEKSINKIKTENDVAILVNNATVLLSHPVSELNNIDFNADWKSREADIKRYAKIFKDIELEHLQGLFGAITEKELTGTAKDRDLIMQMNQLKVKIAPFADAMSSKWSADLNTIHGILVKILS